MFVQIDSNIGFGLLFTKRGLQPAILFWFDPLGQEMVLDNQEVVHRYFCLKGSSKRQKKARDTFE